MNNQYNDDLYQSGSFRDPAGFLYYSNGNLVRQINKSYSKDYDFLKSSGLYEHLTRNKLLIQHEEISLSNAVTEQAYVVIKPELVKYISYPYEWCLGQLQDTALLTLKIQLAALKFGMSLKDASSYNIQFHNGKPILIDTLSFEQYVEGSPWPAYKQFCQHFLAPLLLAKYCDRRLVQLLKHHIDGIPIDLASKLLPLRTYFQYSILAHIHLHAKYSKRYENVAIKKNTNETLNKQTISKIRLKALIYSLRTAISKQEPNINKSEWSHYYDDTNYNKQSTQNKGFLLSDFVNKIEPEPSIIHDLGANTGFFSRIAMQNRNALMIAHDIDMNAVEINYQQAKKEKETRLLPLFQDLTNPSPSLGWASCERDSFRNRMQADLIIALALIHHIAISNNVPLRKISSMFSEMCKWLIIEFVPKEDSQVKRLLSTRKDVFPSYNQKTFEDVFQVEFELKEKSLVSETCRTMYLFKKIERNN